jgi:tRNA-dihydrouridine synthase B
MTAFDSAFSIGTLELDRRVMMAPMAGVTTTPFRQSVRRWGAGLVFTEMISSHGIAYGNRRTCEYLACGDEDHPIGYQIFGADPAIMAHAAEACVAAGADLVDINMACPVRKVVKTGAGAALLGAPDTAVAVARAVVAASSVPVTVKLRAGLRAGDGLGSALAARLADAGVAAVCMHPRTAAQLYRGVADHALTLALAASLPAPVIASGDIVGRDVSASLLDGGCAAVMVARAALGRPWIFQEILLGAPPPEAPARLKELTLFVEETVMAMGPRAIGYLRQFWSRFRASGTIDRETARALMQASDAVALRALLASAKPFCTGDALHL